MGQDDDPFNVMQQPIGANRLSRGLLERYGPKAQPVADESTSLNDSEQMANDLNVADWVSDEGTWRPEGEEGDDWKPKELAAPAAHPITGRAPKGGELFSKEKAAAPPAHIQVNFLTEGILAQHTREQSYEARMAEWRDGAAARGEIQQQRRQQAAAAGAPAADNAGKGGHSVFMAKMHGLHGEDTAPEDDAERAAVGRVLFRPVAGAAALPSGRPNGRGGGIFQSARRAISIRRDLSMRSHGQHRLRPQTVRVAAPLKVQNAQTVAVAQTKAEKEEAAREAEKLAREAARRAARRAAARAAALNAAKQAEEDAARAAREAEQEQADADAQRVAQVARRAAVAREAAQAARRKRQPIFNIDEKDGGGRRVRGAKGNTSPQPNQPSSRPTSQRTNTQSPRTQRSQTAAMSEKGSTRSSPGSSNPAHRRKKTYSTGGRALSHSHRGSSSPDPSMRKPHAHSSASSQRGASKPKDRSEALSGLLNHSGQLSNGTSASTSTVDSSAPPDPLPQGIASPPGTGKPPPPQPPTTSLVSAGTHASNSSHHTAATGERVYLPAQRLNVSAVMPTGASADADAAKPVKTAGGRKSAVASRNLAMPSSPVAVN